MATVRQKTFAEVKQIMNDFYYGKIKETIDVEGNKKPKTEIPSLRRKLKKAVEHRVVIPTADKWFKDIMNHLDSVQ